MTIIVQQAYYNDRGQTTQKVKQPVDLSLRKAANPAVVAISQFRITLMGRPTKPVLLYSGVFS